MAWIRLMGAARVIKVGAFLKQKSRTQPISAQEPFRWSCVVRPPFKTGGIPGSTERDIMPCQQCAGSPGLFTGERMCWIRKSTSHPTVSVARGEPRTTHG